MRAFVLAHVDQFRRFFDRAKRRLDCCVGFADKSYHGPVRARPGINIEQRHAIHRFNHIGNLPNNIQIAPFRKIRHALDQFLHITSADY